MLELSRLSVAVMSFPLLTKSQLEGILVSEYGVNPGRAKRVVQAFLAKHGDPPSEDDHPFWYAWEAEIDMPFGTAKNVRLRLAAERQVARRQAEVERLAARRRELDPGPVAPSRRAASAWARTSAIRGPLWHATRAGPLIMAEGLRSRKTLMAMAQAAKQQRAHRRIETLGGGPDNVVSVSPNRKATLRIAAALAALNEAWDRPAEVYAWFDRHWFDWIDKNVHEIPDYTPRQVRSMVRVRLGGWRRHDLSHDPEHLRTNLNDAAHFFGMVKGLPLAFRVPWIMRLPQRVPPEWIGTVETRACVDQVHLTSGSYDTRGRISDDHGWDLQSFAVRCPTERGGGRENYMSGYSKPMVRFMLKAAVATDTGNRFEADELRLCESDLTVVAFEPMLDWRRVLKPGERQ